MRVPARRLVLFVSIGAAVLAVAGAAAWQVLGDDRRLGRLIGGVLAERTGLPVSVDRARAEPGRLVLRDVRIGPGPALPLVVGIGEVEVGGGLTLLVAPAGRTVLVAATAVSVTVPAGGQGTPAAAALDGVRARLRSLLDWPGALRVRVMDGELRRAGEIFRFNVSGEKTGSGVLDLVVDLHAAAERHEADGNREKDTRRDAGAPTARQAETNDAGPTAASAKELTLKARASVPAGAADALEIAIDLTGDPARLAHLWPAAIPAPSSFSTRSTLRLRPGGEVAATGRITVGRLDAPAVIDFVSRFEAGTGRLSVTRYGLDWPPGVTLEGKAALEGDGRVTASGKGAVDGSQVEGRIDYVIAEGRIESDVTMTPLDVRKTTARFGLPTIAVTARTLEARVSGVAGKTVSVDARAHGLALAARPGVAPRVLMDATLKATAALGRGPGAMLGPVEAATLTLARGGRTFAVVKGASRGAGAWPLAVEAVSADLAPAAPLLPWPAALQGTARVSGELSRDGVLAFRGRLKTDLPRARVTPGTTLTLSGMSARVPVVWTGAPAEARGARDGTGGNAASTPGSVSADRVSAFGLELIRLTGTTRIADERLLLSDLAWTHYGGRGGGWLELALDGGSPPLRARFEGEHVDLAEIVHALGGGDVARVTGRVRYDVTVQSTREAGLVALAHLSAEEGGGEIGVDVLQRLIDSPSVQVESTGILRRTLENLRRFDYASLEGELRWRSGAGFVDLTLRGKKRLGIFPAPVEAINIKNMPLAVLDRALARRTTP